MTGLKPPLRVAVVEDDVTVLSGLVSRLAQCEEIEVTLACSSCQDFLPALPELVCDVLIVDLGLPDGDGRDLIVATKSRHPKVDIMVFTVFGDEKRVIDAIRAGATGYLLKDDSAQELTEAILALRSGQAPISPGIARYLVSALHGESSEVLLECLTPRETDVLRLVAKGLTNREVAKLLGISPNTVASYTKQVYEKLAVSSRNEAVFEATRLGILK